MMWVTGRFTISGIKDFSDSLPIIFMVLIYTLYIAVSEELIFRGFVLSSMRKLYSLPAAIIISNLLFILYHLPKLNHLLHSPYALHLLAAGLLYTFAYLAFNSIWVSIGLHWGWNMAVFSLLDNTYPFYQLGYETRLLNLEPYQLSMPGWLNLYSYMSLLGHLLVFVLLLRDRGTGTLSHRL